MYARMCGTYINLGSINEGYPHGVNDTGALRGPELGDAGELLVPGDLPHVGCGGDPEFQQGPVSNTATVPDIQTSENMKTTHHINLLVYILHKHILCLRTQTQVENVTVGVWAGVETLGVVLVHITVV